jgi:hypothetical protein
VVSCPFPPHEAKRKGINIQAQSRIFFISGIIIVPIIVVNIV